MLAHRVDLADVGARAQQRPRHRLLVGERAARRPARSSWPMRRPTAAPAPDRPVPRPSASASALLGGFEAGGVGDRMAGLDHRNDSRRPAIAVARHRDAGEPVRRRGLAIGRSATSAMEPAALPAASTISRPDFGGWRQMRRQARRRDAPRRLPCETVRPGMPLLSCRPQAEPDILMHVYRAALARGLLFGPLASAWRREYLATRAQGASHGRQDPDRT